MNKAIMKGYAMNNKEAISMERLNLKIPTEIKEYLTVAAAKESISRRKPISLTEYLCCLVRQDMKKRMYEFID